MVALLTLVATIVAVFPAFHPENVQIIHNVCPVAAGKVVHQLRVVGWNCSDLSAVIVALLVLRSPLTSRSKSNPSNGCAWVG